MFRLFVYALLIFAIFIALYGTPLIQPIAAQLPTSMQQSFGSLNKSFTDEISSELSQAQPAWDNLVSDIRSKLGK